MNRVICNMCHNEVDESTTHTLEGYIVCAECYDKYASCKTASEVLDVIKKDLGITPDAKEKDLAVEIKLRELADKE